MKELGPGVRVRLKSGGPLMIIVKIHETVAFCCWDSGTKLQGAIFPVDALEPVAHKVTASSPQISHPAWAHPDGQRRRIPIKP